MVVPPEYIWSDQDNGSHSALSMVATAALGGRSRDRVLLLPPPPGLSRGARLQIDLVYLLRPPAATEPGVSARG